MAVGRCFLPAFHSGSVRSVSSSFFTSPVLELQMATWAKIYHQSAHKTSFCDECGSLLQLPAQGRVMTCELCGKSVDLNCISFFLFQPRQDESSPQRVKLKRRFLKSIQTLKRPRYVACMAHLQVNELCAACGHEEMFFRTAQLR